MPGKRARQPFKQAIDTIAASATSSAPSDNIIGRIKAAKPDNDFRRAYLPRLPPLKRWSSPILIITEVRMPARITGAASGSQPDTTVGDGSPYRWQRHHVGRHRAQPGRRPQDARQHPIQDQGDNGRLLTKTHDGTAIFRTATGGSSSPDGGDSLHQGRNSFHFAAA